MEVTEPKPDSTDETSAGAAAAMPSLQKTVTESCPHLKWTIVFSVSVLFTTLMLISTDWIGPAAHSEIQILLPVIQVLGPILILRFCGAPRTGFSWGMVSVLNACMVVNIWLMYTGGHRRIIMLVTAVGFRMIIGTAWILVAVMACIVAVSIIRGRLSQRKWLRLILKIGFACAVILVPLEYMARKIEASQGFNGKLPLNLKSTDDIRIATVGGSTMLGFPYDPHYGIGRIVVWQLQQMHPQRRIVLDNLAVTGANLEQAMARLNTLTEKPDIVILYSGHNEFFHNLAELAASKRFRAGVVDDVLAYSSLFRTLNSRVSQYLLAGPLGEAEEIATGVEICPQYVLARRLNRYRVQLRHLFEWARQQEISVLFCGPAAAEADFEPNSSFLNAANTATRTSAENTWKAIRRLQKQQAWDEATEVCEAAVEAHPGFAEFHFRLGECLRHLGQDKQAEQHFRMALDLDQFPIRCRSEYREGGLEEANHNDVVSIDASEFLRQDSPSGYLDSTLFLDGVHPNLRATYLLGLAVTDVIVAEGMAGFTPSHRAEVRTSFADSIADLNFSSENLAAAYETTAEVLEAYSEFRGFDTERRLQESEQFQRLAEKLKSGAIQPGEAQAESFSVDVPYHGGRWPQTHD